RLLDGLVNESQYFGLPRGEFRHGFCRLCIQPVLWIYTVIADAVQSSSRARRHDRQPRLRSGMNAAINQRTTALLVCDLTMFRSLLRRARGGLNDAGRFGKNMHVASFTRLFMRIFKMKISTAIRGGALA